MTDVDKPIKKTEYQRLIDRLGLNQLDAARILNVDPRTSRRWALGEVSPPPLVMTLLKILDEHGGVSLKTAERFAKRATVRKLHRRRAS